MKLTLRKKLLAACLAIGILPAAAVSWLTWQSANRLGDANAAQLSNVAVNIADKIDHTLAERFRDVQTFSQNPMLRDQAAWSQRGSDNPIVQSMNDYVKTYGIYELMLLVDLEGRLIAVNSQDRAGKPIASESLYDVSFGNAAWFRDALAGRFGNSTGREELYEDEHVKRIYHNEGLAMGFSAPVRDESGQAIAVWKNVADFHLVEAIFEASYQELKSRNLASAELTLLDANGRVIIDCDPTTSGSDRIVRDMQVVGKLNLTEKNVEAARRVVAGEAGYLTQSFHARKKMSQCAGFTPLQGTAGFPARKWNVLVRVASDEVLAIINQTKSSLLLIGLVAIVGIVIVAVVVASTIVRPITAIVAMLQDIAQGEGDLTKRLELHSNDELGDMARWFNVFVEKLQNMIQDITGNSTMLAESASELVETSEQFAKGADDTTNLSDEVSSAVGQMSDNMTGISSSANEMSQTIQTIASSVEEMTASIGEVAKNAENAAGVSAKAASLTEASNQTISELGSAADEIGKVIEVIQDIAEQTNLLALNATIEAARAGDAGKGFAVVASEVKELAKQTADATGDISSRIEGIQNSTKQSVNSISEVATVIQNVNHVSQSIAAAVEQQRAATGEISRNVAGSASTAQDIARNVSDSAAAAQQITESMGNMNTVIRGNATGASRSQFRGRELNKLADGLRDTLSQFNTGEDLTDSSATIDLGDSVPRAIRDSWERIGSENLVEQFYPRFLAADPRIAPYFANTNMLKQKKVLEQAFVNALRFAGGDPESVEKVGFLAGTHCKRRMNILPELFTIWLEAVLETLQSLDSEWNSQLESLWRSQLEPVIEFVTSRYDVQQTVSV